MEIKKDGSLESESNLSINFLQHDGESPKNYREKNQLKELIREGKAFN